MKEKTIAWAVGHIAAGYVFFYCDINLGTLDVLPDWIFYIFVFQSIAVLEKAIPSIALLKNLCVLLGVWEGINWALTILGLGVEIYLVTILVGVLTLYFNFQLLMNLADLAQQTGFGKYRSLLVLRAVQAVLLTVTGILMGLTQTLWIFVVVVSAQVIVIIWILSLLYSFRNYLRGIPALS